VITFSILLYFRSKGYKIGSDLVVKSSGLLILDSKPSGATVTIFNGPKVEILETPIKVELSPGVANIKINKDGYKEYQRTVEILKEEALIVDEVNLIPDSYLRADLNFGDGYKEVSNLNERLDSRLFAKNNNGVWQLMYVNLKSLSSSSIDFKSKTVDQLEVSGSVAKGSLVGCSDIINSYALNNLEYLVSCKDGSNGSKYFLLSLEKATIENQANKFQLSIKTLNLDSNLVGKFNLGIIENINKNSLISLNIDGISTISFLNKKESRISLVNINKGGSVTEDANVASLFFNDSGEVFCLINYTNGLLDPKIYRLKAVNDTEYLIDSYTGTLSKTLVSDNNVNLEIKKDLNLSSKDILVLESRFKDSGLVREFILEKNDSDIYENIYSVNDGYEYLESSYDSIIFKKEGDDELSTNETTRSTTNFLIHNVKTKQSNLFGKEISLNEDTFKFKDINFINYLGNGGEIRVTDMLGLNDYSIDTNLLDVAGNTIGLESVKGYLGFYYNSEVGSYIGYSLGDNGLLRMTLVYTK
jgi:hypothetical protein